MSRHFFLHSPSGKSWEVSDPTRWCLENAYEPILKSARERLVTLDAGSEPQRVVNVVLRRCSLNLIELPTPQQVVIQYWTLQADLRPFLKAHSRTRPDVQVAWVRRKSGFITIQPGDDFLYGIAPNQDWPWELYRGKWGQRHTQEADDWRPAPQGYSTYSWEGVQERHVPWAVLKSAWRRETPLPCPNCDVPLALTTFSWYRGLSRSRAVIARCCFRCRRLFTEESSGDPWSWVVTTLDAAVLPAWLHGIVKFDLRPRQGERPS